MLFVPAPYPLAQNRNNPLGYFDARIPRGYVQPLVGVYDLRLHHEPDIKWHVLWGSSFCLLRERVHLDVIQADLDSFTKSVFIVVVVIIYRSNERPKIENPTTNAPDSPAPPIPVCTIPGSYCTADVNLPVVRLHLTGYKSTHILEKGGRAFPDDHNAHEPTDQPHEDHEHRDPKQPRQKRCHDTSPRVSNR